MEISNKGSGLNRLYGVLEPKPGDIFLAAHIIPGGRGHIGLFGRVMSVEPQNVIVQAIVAICEADSLVPRFAAMTWSVAKGDFGAGACGSFPFVAYHHEGVPKLPKPRMVDQLYAS